MVEHLTYLISYLLIYRNTYSYIEPAARVCQAGESHAGAPDLPGEPNGSGSTRLVLLYLICRAVLGTGDNFRVPAADKGHFRFRAKKGDTMSEMSKAPAELPPQPSLTLHDSI